MLINSAKELEVYKKAYIVAMEIYEITKLFPVEEKYALTSQIRRSSRSVCLNLREAWAKRRYEAHFISKLTDCDGENSETDSSLDFACDCGYFNIEKHKELTIQLKEIGRMLGAMLNNPKPFLVKK
jgi:four helix bundle protein